METVNNAEMKPLTSKELDYLVDCISNESTLAKHCAATAAAITNPAVQQSLLGMMHKHEQHMDRLVQSLQQHQSLAVSPSH
nr:hypothetical protein [Paenibacillus algicola]